MVQLYDAKKGTSTVSSLKNVRRVVYRKVSDIASLLCVGTSAVATGGPSGSSGESTIPHQKSTLEPTHAALERYESARDVDENASPITEDDVADAAPPVVNLDDDALAFEEPDAAIAQLAQDKLKAAHTFAKFYRARWNRKMSVAKTKLATVIHLRFAHTYRTAYTNSSYDWVDFKHRQYRLLLLIPLPYGMVFLEHVHNHLHETKNCLKKRLKTVKHLELEEVNSKLTECM